jgi:hypothetical protein
MQKLILITLLAGLLIMVIGFKIFFAIVNMPLGLILVIAILLLLVIKFA